MKVKTYDDIENPEAKETLEFLLNLARNDKHNRYPENYTPEMMTLNFDYVGMSFAYNNNGDPFAFSAIQRRDCFNGMVRVLSRFYQYTPEESRNKTKGLRNPVLSFKKTGWIRDFTVQMLDQQVELCDYYGHYNMFISREDKTPGILTRFLLGIKNNCQHKDWNGPPTKYMVCNGDPSRCLQYVIWRGNMTLPQTP